MDGVLKEGEVWWQCVGGRSWACAIGMTDVLEIAGHG